METITVLYQILVNHFNSYPLGVAGRLVYYDEKVGAMILAVHTHTPEKAFEIAGKAWDDLPADIKAKLEENKIGFAVRQI